MRPRSPGVQNSLIDKSCSRVVHIVWLFHETYLDQAYSLVEDDIKTWRWFICKRISYLFRILKHLLWRRVLRTFWRTILTEICPVSLYIFSVLFILLIKWNDSSNIFFFSPLFLAGVCIKGWGGTDIFSREMKNIVPGFISILHPAIQVNRCSIIYPSINLKRRKSIKNMNSRKHFIRFQNGHWTGAQT